MRNVTFTLTRSLVLVLVAAGMLSAQVKPEGDKLELLLEKLTNLERRINQIEARLNAGASAAAPSAVLASTEITAQLEALDQQNRVSERRSDLAVQAETERFRAAPVVVADANGFALQSNNGDFRLGVGMVAQTDGRFFSR
jgi:hypothetical protein